MDNVFTNNLYNHFDAEKYKSIQNSKIPEVLTTSEKYILELLSDKDKYIVDLGAGYGRLLDIGVMNSFSTYLGIENNESMYRMLSKRVSQDLGNYSYEGDLTNFKEILDKFNFQEKKPVFTLLQNTLGTLQGDRMKLIKDLSSYLSTCESECILSLLKQSCLQNEGLNFLKSINFMISDLDYENMNISKGVIKTNMGYVSQRWRKDQIASIKKTMKDNYIFEHENEYCIVLHVSSKKTCSHNSDQMK